MAKTASRSRLSREEAQKLTRGRLLEAARSLFIDRGYGGTSLRDIAAQAGYSQGAFYSNFASKEDLLLELLKEHMAFKMTQLHALLRTAADAAELMESIDRWAAGINEQADWFILAVELRLHASRSTEFAAVYAPMEAQHRADLAELLVLLFERCGKRPPVGSDLLAEGLIALADGMALNREGGRVPPVGPAIVGLLKTLISAAPAKL